MKPFQVDNSAWRKEVKNPPLVPIGHSDELQPFQSQSAKRGLQRTVILVLLFTLIGQLAYFFDQADVLWVEEQPFELFKILPFDVSLNILESSLWVALNLVVSLFG